MYVLVCMTVCKFIHMCMNIWRPEERMMLWVLPPHAPSPFPSPSPSSSHSLPLLTLSLFPVS